VYDKRVRAHVCRVLRAVYEPYRGELDTNLGKFAFGDRTIPIHARTLGFSVPPQWMDVYYGTELSAVVHTNYTPLSENPHLEPRFPDGGWVGRFRFLCCVAVLDVVGSWPPP